MRSLQQIADEHPDLIFQNDGYEYLHAKHPDIWDYV